MLWPLLYDFIALGWKGGQKKALTSSNRKSLETKRQTRHISRPDWYANHMHSCRLENDTRKNDYHLSPMHSLQCAVVVAFDFCHLCIVQSQKPRVIVQLANICLHELHTFARITSVPLIWNGVIAVIYVFHKLSTFRFYR